ncbi:hypothetical protein K0M31_015978 [Melipona bicolor]|uniref:Uncharacterized protein n=1 Tax=Melipona bicolor TaxID=60889 RepID=A0AA40G637_9HYME|nr:hypothetical protein K0M31_015978 [Melipona bicolor]
MSQILLDQATFDVSIATLGRQKVSSRLLNQYSPRSLRILSKPMEMVRESGEFLWKRLDDGESRFTSLIVPQKIDNHIHSSLPYRGYHDESYNAYSGIDTWTVTGEND